MRNVYALSALSVVLRNALDEEGVSSGSATSEGSSAMIPADRSHVDFTPGAGDDSEEDEDSDEDSSAPTNSAKKRTKTSPRDNAFNEVLSFLVKSEKHLKNKLGCSTAAFDFLKNNVKEMVGSKRAVEATYQGTHYIGVTDKGDRNHFKSNAKVTKENAIGYVKVYGPWKKAGDVLAAVVSKNLDESMLCFTR